MVSALRVELARYHGRAGTRSTGTSAPADHASLQAFSLLRTTSTVTGSSAVVCIAWPLIVCPFQDKIAQPVDATAPARVDQRRLVFLLDDARPFYHVIYLQRGANVDRGVDRRLVLGQQNLGAAPQRRASRSEEHTSELQSHSFISYAV